MRPQCLEFVEIVMRHFDLHEPVLEIGSLQEKGQEELANMRSLFPGMTYIGLDMRAGPGVDIVEDAEHLHFDEGSIGTVLCVDTLEHIAHPWLVMEQVAKVLNKEHGVLILLAPFSFPIHNHPSDYYRYTMQGLGALTPSFGHRFLLHGGREDKPHTAAMIGLNGQPPEDTAYVDALNDWLEKWEDIVS